jgi:hypothetical protein
MRRSLQIVLLAAAALVAAACTFTGLAYSNVPFAYNNASSMFTWMVGDYVDMSDDQKEFVHDRFDRAFAWHRTQELPEYRRFFERVLVEAQDNISVDEAAAANRDLRGYYHRAVERLLPDMADFLLRLDSLQAMQMEKRFEKDNRKIVADARESSTEERNAKRLDGFVTHLEQFVGPLTDAQHDMVAAYIASQPDLLDERMADRRYRQAGVLAIVKSKPPREQAIAQLRRLLIETDSWRNADYRQKLAVRDRRLYELIARLSESLSADQRAAFQGRIRGFMRDIAEITASRAGNAG